MAAPLPILAYEDKIVETVSKHKVTVVIGATGSGKTTQLAQFLHCAGYSNSGIIGVTQPRRVATVSVAKRVAQEMNFEVGREVGYSIRFEDRSSPYTKLLFMTDGCLLREFLRDPILSRFSVIVLDEAHERSLNTDILFGLLKKLISQKTDLKILITSATLDGEKFSKFFFDCPIIDVPGRQYFVEVFHSTQKPSNYLHSAIESVIDIHTNQPEGDILVFLTGKEEIDTGIKMLEDKIVNSSASNKRVMDCIILPLHASLAPELQSRIFYPAPENCRRIILSTNVAETSLTVNNIVYVVDCGYVKQKCYDPETGIDSLSVVPISKVQAIQRAGRAGRTCSGKCFRLYPVSVFEHEFAQNTLPEIQRVSLAGAILHLKSLRFADLDVLDFDFLDPPSISAMQDSLKQLHILDAIDADGNVTSLGLKMAELPLEPSLAKSLLVSQQLNCLNACIIVCSMLSAIDSTPLLSLSRETIKDRKNKRELTRSKLSTVNGDDVDDDYNNNSGDDVDHDDNDDCVVEKVAINTGKEDGIKKPFNKIEYLEKDRLRKNYANKNLKHHGKSDEKSIMQRLPDGNGLGDYIFFLQIFQRWQKHNMSVAWCKKKSISLKAMQLAYDISKQLQTAMKSMKRISKPIQNSSNNSINPVEEAPGSVLASRNPNTKSYQKSIENQNQKPIQTHDHENYSSHAKPYAPDDGNANVNNGDIYKMPNSKRKRIYEDMVGKTHDRHRHQQQEQQFHDRVDECANDKNNVKCDGIYNHVDDVDHIELHGFDHNRHRAGRQYDYYAKSDDADNDYYALRFSLCMGFSHHLCQRMQKYNAYKTLQGKSRLVEVHHSCCDLRVDDDGMLPEWLIFHHLMFASSRTFMKFVCIVEDDWAFPILSKMNNVDIFRLSGRKISDKSIDNDSKSLNSKNNISDDPNHDNEKSVSDKANEKGTNDKEKVISSARQRFLARKQAKSLSK